MKLVTLTILIVSIFSLLVVSSLGAYFYYDSSKQIETEAFFHLNSEVILKENQLNFFFNEHIKFIESLSETVEKNIYDPDKLKDVIINNFYHHFQDVSLLNLDGKILLSTDEKEIGKTKISLNEISKAKEGVYVVGFYYDLNDLFPKFMVLAPIRDSNNVLINILSVNFYLDDVNDIILQNVGYGDTEETYLVNNFNYVITGLSKDKEIEIFKKTIHTEDVKACFNEKNTKPKTIITKDYSGDLVLASYVWLSNYDSCLISKIDKTEMVSKLKHFYDNQFFIIILTVFLSLILGFVFSKFITKPINDLTNKVKLITTGDLNIKLGKSSIKDVNNLINSLNRILASLKLAILRVNISKEEIGLGEVIKAKKEIEEKYKLLNENTPDTVILFNKKKEVIYMNKSALDEFNIKENEINDWKLKDYVVNVDKVIKAFDRSFLGKKITVEIEHNDKCNRSFCLVSFIPLFDENKNIKNVFIISRDISKLKDDEKKMLKKNQQLERFANLVVGREEKMIMLKKKVKKLEKKGKK